MKRGICIKLSEIDFQTSDIFATILGKCGVMYDETKYQQFFASVARNLRQICATPPSRTPPCPDPPILVFFFFRFPCLFRFPIFLAFLGPFFVSFPRILGVPRREKPLLFGGFPFFPRREKPLLFFGVFLFFSREKKSKGWRVRVLGFLTCCRIADFIVSILNRRPG